MSESALEGDGSNTGQSPSLRQDESLNFDIVAHYNQILADDPLLTKPVAAIESLISLLSTSPPSTISETLSLIDAATNTLTSVVPNPITFSAGTDLFQRYIIASLQTPSSYDAKRRGKDSASDGATEDFKAVRAHLLANSRLFLQRARDSRGNIASVAKRLIRDGTTVLTYGRSRVVAGVLKAAAADGIRFRVVYVEDTSGTHSPKASIDIVSDLRRKEVPLATISFAAISTVLSYIDLAMLGTEVIVMSGGIVSIMGSHQIGSLMRSVGKPLYITAESHKFSSQAPAGGEDLGIETSTLQFHTGQVENEDVSKESRGDGRFGDRALDFTPPDLITAIITEAGVQTPSAISEELIKMFY